MNINQFKLVISLEHLPSLYRLEPILSPPTVEGMGLAMHNIEREIELLEMCAAECGLISNLAADSRSREESKMLSSEYYALADALRSSYRRAGD
jgi:hypothetical protein